MNTSNVSFDKKSPAQTPATQPNQPKTRPLYRLERREAGKLNILADGLTLQQSYAICDRIAGLHIRFSYNSIVGGAL